MPLRALLCPRGCTGSRDAGWALPASPLATGRWSCLLERPIMAAICSSCGFALGFVCVKFSAAESSFCSLRCVELWGVETSHVGPVCVISLAPSVEQDLSGRSDLMASEGQRLKTDRLKAETWILCETNLWCRERRAGAFAQLQMVLFQGFLYLSVFVILAQT